jgi:RNA polymerase sigma factor (sigma-70 family)
MTYEVEVAARQAEEAAVLSAAKEGEESALENAVERHRRELQVHCYRMLGSFEDSEDLVQETFLRAWRNRASFAGHATWRTWLYRIATNACLDLLVRRPRRALPPGIAPAADPRDPTSSDNRRAVDPAVPGSVTRRARDNGGRAEHSAGLQGDHRARIHRGNPVLAPTAARGVDPARRARLVSEGQPTRSCKTRAFAAFR